MQPNQTYAKWGCVVIADDGSEMLMGWECDTRREAREIREDVLYYRDAPANRVKVKRVAHD